MTGPALPACEYTIDGNPGGRTLVFIHGWPDDATLWRKQVAAFKDRYRCVSVTLPNFGDQHVKRGGLDFRQLVARLASTLDEVQPDDTPVTLITHDWGAYLGYLLEQAHPRKIGRMVALDIGAHIAPGSAKERFFIIGYQWTLIFLWFVGGILPPLGDLLTRRFAGKLGVPPRQAAKVRSRCNYPYFYMWRGLLLPWWRKHLPGHYRPKCPVLFLYGDRKPVMFHSQRWLDIVEKSGGHSTSLENGGHWFMQSHPKEVNQAILDWLDNKP